MNGKISNKIEGKFKIVSKIGYPIINQEYSKNKLKLFFKNELIN